MIKILIADDSATETALLRHIFEQEQDMQVIGCATNGQEAVMLAEKLKPDLITMDIVMPIMNGFEATQLIMMNYPIPIVVISSTLKNQDLDNTFLAMDAGAVSVIEKPVNILDPANKTARKRIIDLIRSMAEIKVIKRRFTDSYQSPKPLNPKVQEVNYEVLAIGASVGGPQALTTILSLLPANFPIPIVIVQHITVGFLEGLSVWLNQKSLLTIKCAQDQEILKPGTVYFAPENYHLEIKRVGNNLVTHYHSGPPVSGFCPSITVLFQSVAKVCGYKAIGMLLTGMGSDGAQGLLELKQKKAQTLVQDEKSSVVFGMAKVALSLGAVDHIIELDQIVDYLKCELTLTPPKS